MGTQITMKIFPRDKMKWNWASVICAQMVDWFFRVSFGYILLKVTNRYNAVKNYVQDAKSGK